MKKRTFITVLSFLLALTIFFQVMPENIVKAQENLELEPVIQTEQKEAEILYEIEDRREEAVKHFKMSDGSVMAAVYSDVVHKEDANGDLVDIDNTLEEDGDVYKNVDGTFDVSFAKKPKSNKMVEINYNGYEISFGIENIKNKSLKVKNGEKNKKSSLTQTASQARYDGAFNGIDLVYDLTGSKIKESIVINEYTGINEFTFVYRFGGLNPVLNDDGSIDLFDGETKVLEIQAPFMFDSANAESTDIKVTLTQQGSKYNYTLSASEEWLTAEDRVYPVTIDPTTSTYHENTSMYDTYTTNDADAEDLRYFRKKRDRILVGTSNGGGEYSQTFGPYRTYIWFDMPTIPVGSRVNKAVLNMYCHPGEWENDIDIETSIRMDLYELPIDSEKDGEELCDAVTWSDPQGPAIDYQCLRTGKTFEGDHYQWNITSIANKYYETGAVSNKYCPGMMLKFFDESLQNNDFYVGFYSGDAPANKEQYKPTIIVYYQDAKGIEGYYDYFASSLDDSGVGYVNAFNGSLNYVNTVVSESGTRLPATVSAYYNSANVSGSTSGWNFSFNQIITHHPQTKDNPYEYYAYTDADGTVHYFSKYDEKFVDETGSGLILENIPNSTDIQLKYEDQQSKTVFEKIYGNWYIKSVEDGLGNTQTYEHSGTLVTSIKDGADRITTIGYSGATVTSIIDASGKTTTFEYSTISPNQKTITKINYPNGKSVQIQYFTGGYIYQVIASTNAKYVYNYDAFNRVCAIGEYDRQWQYINRYTLNYAHKNTTKITDKNNDSLLYQFDFYGKTVSVVDDDGNAMYNAYSNMTPETTTDNYYLRNKLMVQSDLQSTVINYLKNISAEQNKTGWVKEGGAVEIDSDQFIGYNCFKVIGGSAYQEVPVIKDREYTFSSYIKTTSSNSAYLKATGSCATVIGEQISTDNEWERHSITFKATQTGNVKVYMCSDNTAFFDLLQVEDGPAANRVNLLVGGDFGKYESSWKKEGGAVTVTQNVAGPKYSSVVQSQTTNAVLKMQGNYMGDVYAYQNVHLNVSDKGSLVLSGWAKADAVPDNEEYNSGRWFGMYVKLTYADTDRTTKIIPVEFNTAVRIEGSTTADSWQYVCAAIPLDSDYVDHLNVLTASVYLCYNNNINTAYFDNIQLYYEEFGQSYAYDEKGNVITAVDQANQTTNFTNTGSDLSTLSDPDGSNYEYFYSSNKLLSEYKSATGVGAKYRYDQYGNPKEAITYSGLYTESIDEGYYYIDILGMFLIKNGTNADVSFNATNQDNKLVQLIKTEGGYYKIKIGDKYLERTQYSYDNLRFDNFNNSKGQGWKFIPDENGGYQIVSQSPYGENGYVGNIYLEYSFVEGNVCVTKHKSDNVWYLHKVDIDTSKIGDINQASQIKDMHKYYFVSAKTGRALNYELDNISLMLTDVEGAEFTLHTVGNKFVILPDLSYGEYSPIIYADSTHPTYEVSPDREQPKYFTRLIPNENGGFRLYSDYYGKYIKVGNDNYAVTVSSTPATDNSDVWYIFERSKNIVTSAEYSENYKGNYLTSETDALGNSVTYTYDFASGKMMSVTDAIGNTTSYQYDSDDKLTSVTQGGITVQYNYDSNNQLSSITHNNFTYNFIYDALGRNDQTKIGTRLLVDNLYCAESGLLKQSVYGNGQKREYEFDNQYRVKKLIIDNIDRFSYTYDYEGNLHEVKDLVQGITYKYIYDMLGRPVQVRTSDGFRIKLAYDEFNRASDVKFEFGSSNLTTTWRYGKSSIVYGVKYNGVEKITYNYDSLMRRTNTTINTTTPFVTNYSYKDHASDYNRTSTQLQAISYSNNKGFNYTYDANGNITSIKDQNNNAVADYFYDELNQLAWEDNLLLNKTIIYTYDNGGNILHVEEYEYCCDYDPDKLISQKNYTYGDSEWKDLLTNYNGIDINYDTIGNPLNWINGESFTWSGGRQLTGITKGNNIISYAYNDSGIRTSKTVNNVRTDYYLNGTAIIMQKTGDNVIWYTYDENGLVTGFRYNGAEYYYFRNAQNDIIGIVDSSGAVVANYTYDSWGNHIAITDGNGNNVASNPNHIANINPFRYRGYYYDTETGLYYLQSRYYDANVGRFINADSYVSTGQGVTSYNMFAYCLNNPISLRDSMGTRPMESTNPSEENYYERAFSFAQMYGREISEHQILTKRLENLSLSSNKYLKEDQQRRNASLIYEYLSFKGWSNNAICAVLGNMQQESTINPGFKQRGGGGFGLAQWDPASTYLDWASQNGYSSGSLVGQLEYLEYSSQPGKGKWFKNKNHAQYYLSYNSFKTSNASVEYLTQVFLWSYERPGKPMLQNRINYANNWSKYFS